MESIGRGNPVFCFILVATRTIFFEAHAMLLQRDDIARLLELQRKAYEILRWAERRALRGELAFDALHDAWGSREAALAWLLAQSGVPKPSRPRDDERAEVAALIASMLRTSFWFSPAARGGSCRCVRCDAARRTQRRDPARLAWERRGQPAGATRLAPRKLTRHDDEAAATLVRRCLEALAESLGVAPAFSAEIARSRADLELLTYAWQLRRRVEWQSQGKGLVVLWRRVHEGLSIDNVMAAQARLAEALRRHDIRWKTRRWTS